MARLPGEKNNVLVLGGAGFIGSHLCDELVKNNNVICVDNFISSKPENIEHLLPLENFALINGDVNALTSVEDLPEAQKFDVKYKGIQEIYNLAVPTSPKNFRKFKAQTAVTNGLGTINALNLAVKYRAKFMQFSSSVIYGQTEGRGDVLTEDSYYVNNPLSDHAVYDEGKRYAETVTMAYREKYDIDAKVIRIFRTYGPRMQLFEGQMISDFIVAAIDNQPLTIYGTEEFSSSLIYIDDVISAVEKVMESAEGGPYNVGAPMKYRLSDIAQKIINKVGSTSQIEYRPELTFMRELGVPDIGKIKSELDWFPVITIDTGLEKTIEYTRAHKILVDWAKVQPISEQELEGND